MVALGAASVQAASAYGLYAPDLNPMEQTKPWTVGLSVRGFYDDNYTTAPSDLKRESWGVAVSPNVAVNFLLDNTYIGLSYVFDMRWYADRENNEADYSHLANLRINHMFNERFELDVTDRFLVAQEGMLEFDAITTPLRTEGDVVRNVARVQFDAGITEVASARIAYQNLWVDFEQDGNGSRSALLDRMEHLIPVEGLWNFREDTAALIGYQFLSVDHNSSDSIFVPGVGLQPAEIRDAQNHRVYLGVEHDVSNQVEAAVRVGAQFVNYNNLPDGSDLDESKTIPYADARGTWTYNPGSYVQLGVVHTLNQTDVVALDQQSTSVWLLLNHKITPKLTGGLLGRFQYSTFNEGVYDGDNDLIYIVGVNLEYEFIPNLFGDIGYNYDRLDSDIDVPYDRSYDRNRVWFGLRAQY
jgi:hypothetical protein